MFLFVRVLLMVVNERHFNVFHSTNHMFDDDDGAFFVKFYSLSFFFVVAHTGLEFQFEFEYTLYGQLFGWITYPIANIVAFASKAPRFLYYIFQTCICLCGFL